MSTSVRYFGGVLAVAVLVLLASITSRNSAGAHCDTVDGPVVAEAQAALEAGDVASVLKWVAPVHEAEIKSTFASALKVRAQGPEAQRLADRYFFETLIRLHREGEGAPYTGLKPAGTIEPAVAAADQAIADGSVEALAAKIGKAAENAVRERFERLVLAREHKDESVAAGREYVEAYVMYVHFVEQLHGTITQGVAQHGHD